MDKKIINKDLIIIGSGPAGLAAGIYAGRSKLDTLIMENEIVGGQIVDSYLVENYPGFESIKGSDLANKMLEQTLKCGATIEEFDPIINVKLTNDEKIIETSGKIYNATAVIIATGSKHRSLPIPEEPKFLGRGVHYCELCDGEMYTDKNILVVGGGNSAVNAAIYLAKYGKTVTLVYRGNKLKAEPILIESLLNNAKITVLYNTEVISALGDDFVTGVILKNNITNEEYNYNADGIFTYIGMIPQTNMFKEYINLTPYGYIDAKEDTLTNVEGVFACGDVREKPIRQLTTAVSDGTVSSLMAEKYIFEKKM